MICDDAADLRMIYRLWLSKEADIDLVGEASDGAEAVSLTGSLQPDIVLLDIQMPEKDGMEALAEISAEHPDTKVIMLTGVDLPDFADRAVELGAADYISKGMHLDEVAERIRAVHSSE